MTPSQIKEFWDENGYYVARSVFSPEQIAGVATYVRGHFDNAYTKPVTVEDVKRLTPEGEE